MSKRISVEDRLKKDIKRPVDKLFEPTTEEIEDKKEEKIRKASKTLKRQTYYITEELIDALAMYKVFEDKDISVIVRDALYEYIPEVYFELVKDKYK